MPSSSRRAAQVGLGAAILLFITCVTLIVTASLRADAQSVRSAAVQIVR